MPFAVGKPGLVLKDGDTRMIVPSHGALTHEIREKTFEADGQAIGIGQGLVKLCFFARVPTAGMNLTLYQ